MFDHVNVMRMGAANQPRYDHMLFPGYGRISRLVLLMLARLKLATVCFPRSLKYSVHHYAARRDQVRWTATPPMQQGHPCVYANVRHNVCSTPDRSRCRTFLGRVRSLLFCDAQSIDAVPPGACSISPERSRHQVLPIVSPSNSQSIFCGRHRLISRPT